MSAYVVDPRTIDYLVASVHRRRHGDHMTTQTGLVWERMEDVPEEYHHAVHGGEDYGYRLDLNQISKDQLGTILMRQNIRSVSYRYSRAGREHYRWAFGDAVETMPDVPPDDLPGPNDQTRVWSYSYRPISNEIKPAWVVKSCDCLTYQSCETPDWSETLAHAVVDAIREKAIGEKAIGDLTDDAPWGVSEKDLRSREIA